jgi:hypothetical protein
MEYRMEPMDGKMATRIFKVSQTLMVVIFKVSPLVFSSNF